MKELKKQIRELLYQKLSVYGFKKKKQWLLTRVVGDGNVIQVIALCFAGQERNVTHVSIIIGAIYKNINKISMLLGEGDCMEYYTPMVSKTIGNLMPGKYYHDWSFSLEDNDLSTENNVDNLVNLIIEYGFPYLDRISLEENLIDEIKRSFDSGRIIPIAYYLQNNKEQALIYIEEQIKKLSRKLTEKDYESAKALAGENGFCIVVENNALNYYISFVEKFKKLLDMKPDE